MFCKNCGAKLDDNAKFCPSCGIQILQNATSSKPAKDYQKAAAQRTAKKKKGCSPIVAIILLVFVGALIYSISMVFQGNASGYASIDSSQSSQSKYDAIATAMDDALEDMGYFPIDYSVEWIGYSKYRDQYSEEEYEEMQLGGYYTYSGKLSTGELANARLKTYWGDNEELVVLDLSIETALEEKVIVAYSDEKIMDCWNTYYAKAKPVS